MMNRYWKYGCALLMLGALTGATCRNTEEAGIDNTTVNRLDLKRFMGEWYEIARYEHRFERGMTHVTATYTLLPDGKIRVVNRGLKDGEPKEIVGKVKQPDPTRYPGRLEVSFFLWFYSDYYILELDPDYRYAVIGSSSDKYLWILSRTPQMDQPLLENMVAGIARRGYDVSRLVYVEQE